MAKGKTISITQKKENNNSYVTTAQTIESIVVGGQLVPDPAVTEPGVFTRNN